MKTIESHSPSNNVAALWRISLLTALIVAAGLAFYWLRRAEPYDGDSKYYIAIAEGRIAEVGKPFTARLLHPVIAGGLAKVTGMSVDSAFFATNVASLAVLAGIGLTLVMSRVRSVALAAAIVFCPMILIRFREIYLPDCMHAALAAVFFLLLVRGAWWYAMPVVFLMQVTRESTVLLTFVVVLATAFHRKWKLAAAVVLCTLLGIGVVGRFAGEGKGNIHGANTLVYLVGKVPFCFFTNVVGVRMWTNTHAKNDPATFADPPLVSVNLPAWVPTGAMRQIGIYKIDPSLPLAHLRMYLTFLGVMPSLVLLVVGWRRMHLLREDGLSEAGSIALVYGLLAFLMAPVLGTSVGRYLSYAWPLTWIAAPELLCRYFKTSKELVRELACLQAIACWTPLILNEQGVGDVPRNLIAVAVALPCHIMAIRLLKQNRILSSQS